MQRVFVALALIVLAAGAAEAAKVKTGAVNFANGSTGDSCIVAADTSAVQYISPEATSWWVVMEADSSSSYQIQVSRDGTYWYTIARPSGAAIDTVDSGEAEVITALTGYQGMQVRVIVDNLTAAGAPFLGATVVQKE